MGIPIIDNFTYLGKKPLDTRLAFDTIAEMQSYPESRLYDGILVYNSQTEKYYSYKSTNTIDPALGRWREWQQGGGGGGGDTLYPDHLTATKTKTTYDQDETILLNDLVVTCFYTDGTSEIISNYTTNINELDTFTAGLKRLIIEYYHNGIKVSTTINLNVNFTESYDRIQYAYKLSNAGAIRPKVELLGLSHTIYQYSDLCIKLKLKLTIEQNNNNENTTFTVGNSDIFSRTLATQVIPANTVGDYEIIIDSPIEYEKTTKTPTDASPIPLLYLSHNGQQYISGMFEVIDYSFALTNEVVGKPISMTATKTYKYFVEGGTLEKTDIIANVTYSTGETKTIAYGEDDKLRVSNIDPTQLGDQKITVSYSDQGKTVAKTITVHGFSQDKTAPDPFNEKTATEWYNSWEYGTNIGNCFDANNSTRQFGPITNVPDRYVDEQPMGWWQPKVDQQNIQEIADAGFTCLRIPVTWWPNSYIDDDDVWHPGSWYLYRIAEVVNWALEAGLYVFFNTHFDNQSQADGRGQFPLVAGITDTVFFEEKLKRARQLWTGIAEKFKYYDERLAFEGYNEIDNAQNSWQPSADAQLQMNEYNQVFLDAVRSTGFNNRKRVLICPFLIHRYVKLCADNYICPKEPVYDSQNNIVYNSDNSMAHQDQEVSPYVGTAVHWYPSAFDQSIEGVMSQIETFMCQLSIPMMINEYGLAMAENTKAATHHCTEEEQRKRLMYFPNFISRAKIHRLKVTSWDDGAKHNIVLKHNHGQGTDPIRGDSPLTQEQSDQLVAACGRGWNNNLAYILPLDQVQTYNSFGETLHYGNLNEQTGEKTPTTDWMYMYTSPIPCQINQTIHITITQASEVAITQGLFVNKILFYTSTGSFIKCITLGWGKKNYSQLVDVNAGQVVIQFYVAGVPKITGGQAKLQEVLFDKGDCMDVAIYSDGDETPVILHERIPEMVDNINVISGGLIDGEGNVVEDPIYTMTVKYKLPMTTMPEEGELPQHLEQDTQLTYYSNSTTSLGTATLIKPTIHGKGVYEYGMQYVYNGTELNIPYTGITFKYGKWVKEMLVDFPSEYATYNISTMDETQIKQAIQDNLTVTLVYTDDTTQVLTPSEYTLDYSTALFNELGTYTIGVNYHDTEESVSSSISYTLISDEVYKVLATYTLPAAIEWLTTWVTQMKASYSSGTYYNAAVKIENYYLNSNLGVLTYNGKMIPYVGKIIYCVQDDTYYWLLDPNVYTPSSNGLTYYMTIMASSLDKAVPSPVTAYSKTVQLSTTGSYTDSHNRKWYNLSRLENGFNTDADHAATALSKGILQVNLKTDLDDISYTTTFCNKYVGTVFENDPSEATVESLNSEIVVPKTKGGTYTLSGENVRICYAIPQSLGELTDIKYGADSIIDNFVKTDVTYTQNGIETPYYRYVSNEPETLDNYSVIFT